MSQQTNHHFKHMYIVQWAWSLHIRDKRINFKSTPILVAREKGFFKSELKNWIGLGKG